MVQSAESWKGSNVPAGWKAWRDRPTHGCVLSKPQMRPVVVVVADVLGHEPFPMPLIQNDHRIQHVSTAASHPALRNTILPGCAPQKLDLNSSCHFLQPIFMMESAKNVSCSDSAILGQLVLPVLRVPR